MLETWDDHLVVCFVWSFKNDDAVAPYRITRRGASKKDGGSGYQWLCSCPHFTNRHQICKHLKTMREEAKNGIIFYDKRYSLTDFGKKVLKLNE